MLGAANRDPAVFAEPHRLDVTRDARRHVGLGGGTPRLGAALARMETQIALAGLLDRFGSIALLGAPDAAPDLHPARAGNAAGRAVNYAACGPRTSLPGSAPVASPSR